MDGPSAPACGGDYRNEALTMLPHSLATGDLVQKMFASDGKKNEKKQILGTK